MFYTLGWLAVSALIALWSLVAWALHAVAVWTVSNAGALSAATAVVGDIVLPGWLAPWVPAELAQVIVQLATALGPLIDRLLQAAPALAGGITVAAWVVWSLGSVLLVLLGAGLHLLMAVWRRRGGAAPSSSISRSMAAG
ncbi:MAG: hypothetical protein RJA44_2524 [Pseudomonadota bacterium]|jgi:hypothetical protein